MTQKQERCPVLHSDLDPSIDFRVAAFVHTGRVTPETVQAEAEDFYQRIEREAIQHENRFIFRKRVRHQ